MILLTSIVPFNKQTPNVHINPVKFTSECLVASQQRDSFRGTCRINTPHFCFISPASEQRFLRTESSSHSMIALKTSTACGEGNTTSCCVLCLHCSVLVVEVIHSQLLLVFLARLFWTLELLVSMQCKWSFSDAKAGGYDASSHFTHSDGTRIKCVD